MLRTLKVDWDNKVIGSNSEKPLSSFSSNQNAQASIFIRSNKKYIQLFIREILYIEAAGNYTKIITPSDPIIVREKISELLMRLNHSDLIQVHKSFAAAKKHIKSVEGNRIFIKEHIIPIGKIYKASFLQSLNHS